MYLSTSTNIIQKHVLKYSQVQVQLLLRCAVQTNIIQNNVLKYSQVQV